MNPTEHKPVRKIDFDTPPVFTASSMVVLTCSIVAMFALLFPSNTFYLQEASRAEPSQVSAAYLRLYVDARPDDMALRLSLSRHLREINELEEAEQVLSPVVVAGRKERKQALLLRASIDLRRLQGMTGDDPLRELMASQIAGALTEMTDGHLTVEQVDGMAGIARAMGAPDLAARIYVDHARHAPLARVSSLRHAAHDYLAAGHPLEAARIHARLANELPNARGSSLQRRHYQGLAVRYFREAGRGAEAMTILVTMIAEAPDDAQLLALGYEVAIQSNRPELSTTYGRRLIELDPSNATRLVSQIDRELAAGQVDTAYVYATRAVRLLPDSTPLRRKTAQLAEWSGRPEAALDRWLALARRTRRLADIGEASRLAKMLWDLPHQLEMELLAAGIRPPSIEQVLRIATLYEDVGEPEAARSLVYTELAARPESQKLWGRLAALDVRMRRPGRAADIRLAMRRRSGSIAQDDLQTAKLLWRSKRLPEAHALLQSRAEVSDPRDRAFWRTTARVAYLEADASASIRAHRKLWAEGWARVSDIRRFALLLLDQGHEDEAGRVAAGGWKKHRISELGEIAGELALRNEAFSEVLSLLSEQAVNRVERRTRARLLTLRARAHLGLGQRRDARASLTRALGDGPDDLGALYLMYELLRKDGSHPDLERFLSEVAERNPTSPGHIALLADGYSTLGDVRTALIWKMREDRSVEHDDRWLLDYADLLEKNKWQDAARRVHTRMLKRHRRRVAEWAAQGVPESEVADALALAHVALAAQVESPELYVRPLMRHVTDKRVLSFVVAWCLDKDRAGVARSLIQRSGHDRTDLPPWQQLGLAYAENDEGAIRRLLDRHRGELAAPDRVEALRRLRRHQAALALATRSARGGPDDERLIQVANDIVRADPSYAAATAGAEAIGKLSLQTARADVRWASDRASVRLEAAVHRLRSSDDALVPRASQVEINPRATVETPFRRGQARLRLGAHVRGDRSVLQSQASVSASLARQWDLDAEVAINQTSELSDFMRVQGLRDDVRTAVSYRAHRTLSFRAQVWGSQHLLRDRSVLARSLSADLNVLYRLKSSPHISLAARTGGRRVFDYAEDRERLVPQGGFQLAAGARFATGSTDGAPGFGRRTGLFAEAWTGIAGATVQPWVDVRAGVSVPVLGRDAVRATAYYNTSSPAQEGGTALGAQVQYVLRLNP